MQSVSTQAEMQADDFVLANMLGKEAEVKGKVLPRAEGPYPIIGVINSGKRNESRHFTRLCISVHSWDVYLRFDLPR